MSWSEKYKLEALKLIKLNKEKYIKFLKESENLNVDFCSVGLHRVEKITKCKKCGKYFCKYHGDVNRKLCNHCLGVGLL